MEPDQNQFPWERTFFFFLLLRARLSARTIVHLKTLKLSLFEITRFICSKFNSTCCKYTLYIYTYSTYI